MGRRYYVVCGGSYGSAVAPDATTAVWRLLWIWQQRDRSLSPVGRVSLGGYDLDGSVEFSLQPFVRLVDPEAEVYEVRQPGSEVLDRPPALRPPARRAPGPQLRARHRQVFDPAYQHLEPLAIRARYQPLSRSHRTRARPPTADPTPADIAKAAAQIRQQWDEAELERRLHPAPFGRGEV